MSTLKRAWTLALTLLIALTSSGGAALGAPPGTQGGEDVVYPQVIDVWPFPGEEMPLDSPLTITFDLPMDQPSVEAAFAVAPGVTGSLRWEDARTLVFTPTDGWARGAVYEVVIGAGAQSLEGAPLAEPARFTVRTVGYLEVSTVVPAPDAEGVAADAAITVAFSRPVVPLVVSDQIADLPSPLTIEPAVEGKGEWLNTSIYQFTPAEPLKGGATYNAIVHAGLTDLVGAVLEDDFVWQFSTLPPEVLRVSPQQGATNVLLESQVQITFSQPMDRASVEEGFQLLTWGRPVEGAFGWDEAGTVMTFIPAALLDIDSAYTINLAGTARSAAGDATLREGITYTFSTVPYPAVSDTSPRNGEAGVRPGRGVSISFRSPMNTETFRDKVLIDPAPESWTPRVSGNQSLYLEFATLPNTAYTITFLAGAEDVYGNAIQTDYRFFFVTGPLENRAALARQGDFMITSTHRENTRLALAVTGTPSLNFRLYRLPLDHFQTAVDRNYYYDEAVPWATAENLVREWSQSFDSAGAEYAVREVLLASEGGGALDPGLYWIEARGANFEYWERFAFGVATANVTLKRTEDEALVWVTDLVTAAPIANATVTLYQGAAPRASGQTGEDGVFRAPVATDRFLYAVAESEGVYGIWHSRWASDQPRTNSYIYTDRPIYRPDQTLYFRGALRDRDDMTYTVPAEDTVHVIVEVNWGEQVLFEGDLPVTDYGTFSGEIEIPADARLGQGQIRVTSGRFQNASVAFTLAEFRVPEYQVSVSAERDSIIQGETLAALVQASYYFGGPVSSAPLEWVAYGQRGYFNYTGPGRYTFSDEDNGYYAAYEMDYYGPYYGGWFEVGRGAAVTDANGQYIVTADNTRPDFKGPMRITVEATITDESQQAISGRTTVMAHPANLYVGLRTDRYFGKEGQPMVIDLIAVTPESAPIADRRIDLTVTEIRWTRVERPGEFGRYDWQQEESEVETASVTTGADGTAAYTFTPPNAGIFRVRASAMDEKERVNSAALRFWVTGARPVWWGQPSQTIDLIADKDSYRPGDVAEVLVPIPFAGGSTVLVSMERAGVIAYDVVQVEGSTLLYELPITDAHVPTVHLSVTLVKGVDAESINPDYREGHIALSVEPVRQTLTVEVTPSQTLAQPRDTVSFDVVTRDSTGEPVSAEVGLGLTDLAILSLMPPNSGPIRDTFYGRQGNYVSTGVALSALMDRLTDEFLPTERDRALGTATPAATLGAAFAGDAMMELAAAAPMAAADEAGGGQEAPPPLVREEFEQTPLWAPHVVTDATGRATVSVDLPDNLTTWRLDARALTLDTKVGDTTTDVVVTLPLLVRPVAPRFFVVGDRVQLAAVINNNTGDAQTVQATLEAEGVTLVDAAAQTVEIPAASRGRVTWEVVAQDVPYVDLTFIAVGADGYQDASKPTLATGPEGTIPVYRYTAPDTVGTGGVLREAGSRTEGVSLPPRLDTDQGELTIRLDPSLAVTAIDAFNYLKNYPHQCIEQTVSRFLPNSVTYRALRELGIDDPELRENLRVVIGEAVNKLKQEQKADGGWGWFATMESNPLVTAYAALGLIEARDAGFDFDTSMIERALNFVRQHLIRPTIDTSAWRLNRQAFYLYVLARGGQGIPDEIDALFQHRLEMSYEARGFLLMAYKLDMPPGAVDDDMQALISDLTTAAIISATGAHWEEDGHDWWNWTSDTRATAVILAALTRTQPDNDLLPNVVRWLMVARQGDHWTTTQETVWAVLGLTDWMTATGELEGAYTWGASLNRDRLAGGEVTPDTVREGQVLRVAVADLLRDEVNRLTISRGEGPGALYYTAHLNTRLWASEVEATSRGVTVQREYFLAGDPDRPVTGATVGETITVRLTITTDQDIYYFVLEDPIPAGAEGVNTSLLTTSTLAQDPTLRPAQDYRWWWGWWWFGHTEMRDAQVNLYADFLPRGTYVYSYQIRASIAGAFQTMPAHAYAFYFPEVFGRTDGTLFTVTPE
ncbi:MAG: hypothetical protein Kow00120_10980 [Anaerolineae bacterium]